MTAVWHFYWPVFVAALILGLVAGLRHFRKPNAERSYAISATAGGAAVLVALGWHTLGGAADQLALSVERGARITLDNYEMQQVTARLEGDPLKRTLILSGPADDFQQRELLRIMNEVPGVQAVKWDRPLARRKGR